MNRGFLERNNLRAFRVLCMCVLLYYVSYTLSVHCILSVAKKQNRLPLEHSFTSGIIERQQLDHSKRDVKSGLLYFSSARHIILATPTMSTSLARKLSSMLNTTLLPLPRLM